MRIKKIAIRVFVFSEFCLFLTLAFNSVLTKTLIFFKIWLFRDGTVKNNLAKTGVKNSKE